MAVAGAIRLGDSRSLTLAREARLFNDLIIT